MDKNIHEALRKPRRTKGTPAYSFVNFVSLAVFAFGGACWFLFE